MTVPSIRALAPLTGLSHTALNKHLKAGRFQPEPAGGFDPDKVRAALGLQSSAPAEPPELPAAGMRIELWPIDRPVPYPKNARKWSDRAIATVAASIREYGFRQPIVVDAAGVIVIGHLRLAAAKSIELKEVPVHVARDLTPAQIKGLRIADNRTSQEATWDFDLLGPELLDLKAMNFDLALTGFDTSEISGMLVKAGGAGGSAGLTDPDAAPEPPVDPVTVPGDLWLLGGHKVLCGDSTQVDAVLRLMGGEKAGLMATDPPYGVALRLEDNHEASNAAKGIDKKYRHFETIMGDDMDGPKLQGFLESAFVTAMTVLQDNAAWYLWHAQLTQGFFAAAAAAAQLLVHRQIIWIKPHFVFGHGDYHWQHELCFYGWRKTHRPPFYGERNQSTTWVLSEGGGSIRKDQHHPTQKPVELFLRPIKNHLKPGEICYEPFAGSGSQVIAAETTSTRCFALEIDPRYVDVIVSRWQQFTGKQATLDGDGRTFDELKAARTVSQAAA